VSAAGDRGHEAGDVVGAVFAGIGGFRSARHTAVVAVFAGSGAFPMASLMTPVAVFAAMRSARIESSLAPVAVFAGIRQCGARELALVVMLAVNMVADLAGMYAWKTAALQEAVLVPPSTLEPFVRFSP
jgi:hypothetical protein